MARDKGSRIEDNIDLAETVAEDTDARVGRHAETRMAQVREQYKRDLMNMTYRDVLYVDEAYKKPGFDYLWVRESLHGEPDVANFADARRRGWEPVKADRFADVFSDDLFGKSTQKGGYRYQRGLVLCERPKDIGDLERQRIQEESDRVLRGLKGLQNNLGDNLTQSDFNHVKRGYTHDF